MITQHTDYGSIGSDIQNLVANNVSLLDSYILMQTGQYEYTALIKNLASKEVEEIIITRGNSNYNTNYSVMRQIGSDFDFPIPTFEYT